MEFKVTPDVLIPRPETAELVERIITDYRGQAPRILDIGTGSGCIAISLAKHLPKAEVAAVDISPEALAVAEENARLNQVSVSFLELDILSEGYPSFMQGKLKFHVEETKVSRKENKSFTYMKPKSHTEETAVSPIGNFNCIVSNPPYIMDKEKATMEANVLENEPHLALFVPDDDPLLFYRAIARFGQRHLAEGGHLYFEINALCGKETVAMLRQENYTEVELIQDLYGKDRIVKAKYERDNRTRDVAPGSRLLLRRRTLHTRRTEKDRCRRTSPRRLRAYHRPLAERAVYRRIPLHPLLRER